MRNHRRSFTFSQSCFRSSLIFVFFVCLPIAVRANDSSVRQAPERVAAGQLGVGQMVPDFEFTDINGREGSLSELTKQQTVVVAMTGTGCPLCKKYGPTLATLEQRFRDKQVAFVFINPNQSEDLERLREEVKEKGFQGPYIRDDEESITRLLDVKTTTEMFVIDRARTLVYRGAVDDQYGIGYALDAPRNEYLIDALQAVAVGQTPSIQATTSPGCEMFYQSASADAADTEPSDVAVTYHNQVARIIQRNCLECHRDGSVAPMPLGSYQQVRDFAGMIRTVVDNQTMPPWFAKDQFEPDGAHKLVWANDRSLAESERTALMKWVETGAPEGDPADAPLPKTFADGWLIGEPDDVFQFPTAVPIKANGTLDYKNITVETNLEEDKWVQAIEIVPGDRSVVHHVLVFVLPPRQGLFGRSRSQDDGINYWGIYVPGNSTQIYPEGMARKLPKGSRLKFQMHYTTNGTATEDRTKIGVVYAKTPPKFEVKTESIVNAGFTIKPFLAGQDVSASKTLPADYQVLGYLPHHHLRGVKAEYRVTAPGEKESKPLLEIPEYDFNWQLYYQYSEPQFFAKGTRIDYRAWYDNSSNNPANPKPAAVVKWGKQTTDEMHIGYVEYVVPIGSKDPKPSTFLGRLDVNADGELTRDEVKERMPNPERAMKWFDMLDRNKDGKLDAKEAARLR